MTGMAAASSNHLEFIVFFIVVFIANLTRLTTKNNDNTSQRDDDFSRKREVGKCKHRPGFSLRITFHLYLFIKIIFSWYFLYQQTKKYPGSYFALYTTMRGDSRLPTRISGRVGG